MPRSILSVVWMCLALFVAGCSELKEEEASASATGPVTLDDFQYEDEPHYLSASTLTKDRHILRTASIELEVHSFDRAERTLSLIATRYHGYVADASRRQVDGTDGKKGVIGRIDLRVPGDYFEGVLQYARAQGRVRSERISSEDVTDQIVDHDARLKTQLQLEERLLNLLNTKSGGLKEIVELEEKLASVRENIEVVQAQMRHLKDRVAMATLSVTFSEPNVNPAAAVEDAGWFVNAMNDGTTSTGTSLTHDAAWLMVLFSIIISLLLLYLIRSIVGKRRRRGSLQRI